MYTPTKTDTNNERGISLMPLPIRFLQGTHTSIVQIEILKETAVKV